MVLALFGLIFGSFINALVWRLHVGKSVASGRSECPYCKHELAWFDLIPLVSYFWLRGKCRSCSKHISWQYPIVELTTAILFGLLAYHFGIGSNYALVQLSAWLIITILLIAAATFDARYQLLPDVFTLPALGMAVILLLVQYFGFGQHQVVWNLLGAAVFVAFYGLLYLGSKGKWIGQGDIILAGILGLLLVPSQLAVAVFATYVVGAVVGGILLVLNKAKRGHHIAFGPFLVVGLYIGLFWGQAVLSWYLGLI